MKTNKLAAYLDFSPRHLLFYFAVPTMLLSVLIAGLSYVLNSPVFYLFGTLILAFWFVLIFAAVLPKTDIILKPGLKLMQQGAAAIFTVLFAAGLIEIVALGIMVPHLIQNQNVSGNIKQLLPQTVDAYRYNDASALSQQAVDNLLKGENPYAHANIIQALQTYQGSYSRVTPLQLGTLQNTFPVPSDAQLQQVWDKAVQTPDQAPVELESNVSYPAGSFLLPLPFIYFGIHDIRIVYAIFLILGLACTAWLIPKNKRLIFIGLALISLQLWNSLADGGELGSLCFPFLIVAWLTLDKKLWVSAVCMGIAVSTKQTAWFFLPFYLILMLKTVGFKKCLAPVAVIAGIFIATNLPFIIAGPQLWINGVTSPMTDPMFPLGSGLITLVTSGLVNIQSSLPFTVLEGLTFIAGIVWYFKYARKYPQTGPLLAIVPLFFAWRSMYSYFFYADLIALAYILVKENGSRETLQPANAQVNKIENSTS